VDEKLTLLDKNKELSLIIASKIIPFNIIPFNIIAYRTFAIGFHKT
jgi:hypothetical protein